MISDGAGSDEAQWPGTAGTDSNAYGRGRIIGDYRRVALYGTTRLIEAKRAERALLDEQPSTPDVIRDREELAEQIRALGELTRIAAMYGRDVSRPAVTGHEAVQ